MHKKDNILELTKKYNSDYAHKESFENKNPIDKKCVQSSIELNTYTEEEAYEKDINDSYSRKNVSLKRKSAINAMNRENVSHTIKSKSNTLSDISFINECIIDNDNVASKKPRKKKKHDKSLNSIELTTNDEADYNVYEKNSEQNINDFDSTENVCRKEISEMNSIADISLRNNFSMVSENIKTKKPKKKKKHNESLNSIEFNTNYDSEFKKIEITREEINRQNIYDSDSTENKSQKSMSKMNAIADISLGDNCIMNNDDVTTKKPKKKKKHSKSLISIESNTNNDDGYKKYEKYNEQNINDSDLTEIISQKSMSKMNAIADISLGDNCFMNNDDVTTKKPKKKKKHSKSLISIESKTNNVDGYRTYEKYNEQNINESDSTEIISQKSMSKMNAIADISLGDNCIMNNDDVTTKKPKKKKKHSKSLISIESNTNNDDGYRTYEKYNEQNINDSDSTEIISQKSMSKMNAIADISLGDNCIMNNDDVTTKKPKKKKKHSKSLISIESNTNNDDGYRTYEKYNEQNINDSDSTEIISQKSMSKMNAIADISLGDNCIMNNDDVTTKKPKKKKKHSKSLISIESKTNNDDGYKTYEKYNEQNINVSDSTEIISQKSMSKMNAIADISLGDNCIMNNDDVTTKKPKKKKKHSKSLISIESKTNNDDGYKTYEKYNEQNINVSDSTEIISQKCMSQMNTITDISLGDNCIMNNDNITTKKPKMKKKHNKSLNSIGLNTNNAEIKLFKRTCDEVYEQNFNDSDPIDNLKNLCTKKNYIKSLNLVELNSINNTEIKSYERTCEEVNEQNIIDSYSRKNVNRKRKSEINALEDISLGDNCSINNENVPTKKTKKETNHDGSLNSVEINTNQDSDIKAFERICKEVSDENVFDSGTKALTDTSLVINSSMDTENVAIKKSKKKEMHDKIKASDNNHNMKTKDENKMPSNSQNQHRLKTLLNSIELYDIEDSSSNIKTNLNLKSFNLMKYLINKDPSLKNHHCFGQIKDHLSRKIKLTINKKYELRSSDILLLKLVGKIILKKIVEKIDSAQDIKYLKIELPPECKENKIHFMETTLSRIPSKDKLESIRKCNPLVKLRIFNEEEDNLIREYWSKFQKEYKITNILPFLSNGLECALSLTERLQFVRYISAELPNRLLYSVFRRFNILFNEFQDKTCFSEEEDQLIMKVHKCDAFKNKYSVLCLILNRTRLQLYRRYEFLINHHCNKISWDDQKRQELFTNILLETNTEHWTHLKNLTITKDILIKIAKNLGENVNYQKLKYQWNHLYTMLFCEKPILLPTFNLIVLELLLQINPKYWSDLNWKEITNKLYPGANSKVICAFFRSWVDKKVPPSTLKNVRASLNYMKNYEVEKLKARILKHGERKYPRLTVKHYDLLVIDQ